MFPTDLDFSFKKFFVPLTTIKAIHIIIIVGIIVFCNMLFNGFVWDDKQYILQNQSLHAFNFANLVGPNMFNTAGQYRPIPALYFSLLYTFFQDHAFFYHFFSLGIHITNASLLFFVLKKYFSKQIALFLSLIFLVHPIQVESVTYIAAAGNLLFFSFGILALLLNSVVRISTKRLAGIFLLILLSLLSKETGILFLLIALLQRFLFGKQQRVIFVLCASATLLIYFVLRFVIGEVYFAKLPLIPIARLSLQERLLNVPMVIYYYIKTFFFPLELAVAQQWVITRITFSTFFFPLLIDLFFFSSLVTNGYFLYKKHLKEFYIYLFFFIWLALGLGMYSQIYPLDNTIADRWAYFPLAGFLGLVGIIINQICNYKKKYIPYLYALLIFIVCLLSIRTMVRNADWVNAITLFTNARRVQDNYDVEYYLGGEYIEQKQYDEALKHYYKSVELFPYEFNIYNIGYVYELKGNLKKAEDYYYKALQVKSYFSKPKYSENTYGRLAYVLLQQHKYQEARTAIYRGLAEHPNSKSLWYFLAITEKNLQHHKEALKAAEQAKYFWPGQQTEMLYEQISNERN